MVDGCALDKLLAAFEQNIEQQREGYGDDEGDNQAETQREMLPDLAQESFHRAVSFIKLSNNCVIVSESLMMTACR